MTASDPATLPTLEAEQRACLARAAELVPQIGWLRLQEAEERRRRRDGDAARAVGVAG